MLRTRRKADLLPFFFNHEMPRDADDLRIYWQLIQNLADGRCLSYKEETCRCEARYSFGEQPAYR
jgi:hypothetical protein